MPYKQFAERDVITASGINTFVMNQSVMVFDDEAARSAAVAAPIEGMMSYLKDTNWIQFYDGTTWRDL